MRSNYSPYQQQPRTALDQHLSELELAKRQVQQAVDNLNKVLTDRVPLMLRHHTNDRQLVKIKLEQVKATLQHSTKEIVATIGTAFALAMADIESKRAEYHSAEQVKAEAAKVKKQEKATLTYDQSVNQYYITRYEQVTGTDGQVRQSPRKVYLPDNHEYLK